MKKQRQKVSVTEQFKFATKTFCKAPANHNKKDELL